MNVSVLERAARGAACVPLALLFSCGPPPEPVDLVLANGRVWTASASQPWAEAVAIKGNAIAAVGATVEIDAKFSASRRIDLEGRLLVPGFNDAHLHFLSGSQSMDQVSLDDAGDLQEMQRRVKAWADSHPQAAWILGRGWIYSNFPGGAFPSRQDLDAVVADRPVALSAYDGHTTWVNSRALEAAGINRRTVFSGFGEIVRDARTGEPTGILKEDAGSLVDKVIPQQTEDENLASLRRGLAEARHLGLTSALNATGKPEEFQLYEKLLHDGELTLRTAITLTVDRDTQDETLESFRAIAAKYHSPMLRGGFVKLFTDGVVESHTASMLAPYSDDPRTSGTANFTPEELTGWVKKLDATGFDILVHAIGDRGVRLTLDAFQAARTLNPARTRRHRIEHIEVIDAADIPRFKDLGVIASMQPLHGAPDVDGVWARNVGKERLQRAFAWRSLRDAGAHLAHGSDWPVVTLNPYHGIYTAVTRGHLDGRPEPGWAPEQRLTIEQAMTGYTIDAAYATGEEGQKGSIEPGKWADLVVLSSDLFSVPPEQIPATESLLTILDGKIIHTAGPFQEADSPN